MDASELVQHIGDLSRPLDPKPTNQVARLTKLPIKFVLFDIYGTLLISGSGDVGTAKEQTNAAALKDALQFAGFSGDLENIAYEGAERLIEEIKAVHASLKAGGADYPEVDIASIWLNLLQRWTSEGRLLGRTDRTAACKVAVDYECRVNPVWPMPEAGTLLQHLQASGIPFGIVSNAQFYTPLLFEALMGGSVHDLGFDEAACVWSYELLRAKPSESMFEPLLSQLRETHGVEPGEVLYVGNDMLNDVMTASRAGCRTALFAGDARSLRLREEDARCNGVVPDVVLTELLQLKEVLL